MKRWQCQVCDWIYDEALCESNDGIAPKTLWINVPDDWVCPDCGIDKSQFNLIS